MPEDDTNTFRVVIDTPTGGAPALPPNEGDAFEAQAGVLQAIFHRESKDLDFDKVKDEWKQRLQQVDGLAEVADTNRDAKTGLRLTEIELGLTITAEGHLAFIASASASATLTVHFSRP